MGCCDGKGPAKSPKKKKVEDKKCPKCGSRMVRQVVKRVNLFWTCESCGLRIPR